jgi:cytochrome P450
MVRIIEERLESGKRKNDILQILIDSQKAELKGDRLNNEDIVQENILFLIASSETTSWVQNPFLRCTKRFDTDSFNLLAIQLDMLSCILLNSQKFSLGCEELDDLYSRNSKAYFSHDDHKSLPYLNAVINETMRLKPVAMNGLPRQTHHDYLLGGKYHIPKEIFVTAHINACQTNPEYWPETLAVKPERWL